MSQQTAEVGNRTRKNVEDAVIFGTAVLLSAGAILQLGVLGLAVGSVFLSIAAAVVVGREETLTLSGHDHAVVTDGGRDD